MFLRNAGTYLQCHMVSQPRTTQSEEYMEVNSAFRQKNSKISSRG
jgi:hypothetical protein